jgi:hypothetical protein
VRLYCFIKIDLAFLNRDKHLYLKVFRKAIKELISVLFRFICYPNLFGIILGFKFVFLGAVLKRT